MIRVAYIIPHLERRSCRLFEGAAGVPRTVHCLTNRVVESRSNYNYFTFSSSNSLTLGYASIPGVFATTSHPHLDGLRSGDLESSSLGIDEPLLPKICLTLIWSEKPEGVIADANLSTPNRAFCFSVESCLFQFPNS